jgi:methylenetetrahydrofolate dehydrogenase (NADP+)/methenyltetrahydrofolate cyclohydrolase
MPIKPLSLTDSGAVRAQEGSQLGRILDGRAIANDVCEQVRLGAQRLFEEFGVRPALAAILVGDDPASRVYVETKRRTCERVGIVSYLHHLPATVTEDEIVHLIYRLNRDRSIHGILVQLPLPEGILDKPVLAEILPDKDVDGLTPISQARLLAGEPGLRPCTPLGVMELIDRTGANLCGMRVVMVGTSVLVGKPLVSMLLERNATVTLCHEFTRDLPAEIARAELLISATGKAGLIRGEWLTPGCIVIDVGIVRTAAGIRGDVDFDSARKRASFITPVPGGVGPMTVAMLMKNTLLAARHLTIAEKNQ